MRSCFQFLLPVSILFSVAISQVSVFSSNFSSICFQFQFLQCLFSVPISPVSVFSSNFTSVCFQFQFHQCLFSVSVYFHFPFQLHFLHSTLHSLPLGFHTNVRKSRISKFTSVCMVTRCLFRMGAYKHDVVVVNKVGAYIHGVLILCGCLYHDFTVYWCEPSSVTAASPVSTNCHWCFLWYMINKQRCHSWGYSLCEYCWPVVLKPGVYTLNVVLHHRLKIMYKKGAH